MPSDSPTTSLALRPKPALLTGVESFVRQWWPVGLFSVLWLDLIRQLSYQWSNREQYAYGWFVPFQQRLPELVHIESAQPSRRAGG